MTEDDFFKDDFDELDQVIELDSFFINKRISVRYRRQDIKAMVKTHSLIFPQLIPVNLLDISSKGAAVMSHKKLRLKSRVDLFLHFNDGNRFTVFAIVANKQAAPRYGLKFLSYQTELAEHLLNSQTSLEFS